MKRNSRKMLKVTAAALALLLLTLSLASCGTTLSGTYESSSGNVTLEFKGDKVICTQPANLLLSLLTKETETFTGTYKIEDNVITFTFEKEGCTVAGEHKIEMGTDYFKLDGSSIYTK